MKNLILAALSTISTAYGAVIHYQLPSGMELQKFPVKKIEQSKIANEREIKQLKLITESEKIPYAILFSDFDGDGVRDFTLSTGKNKVIISAEDDDWDEDGIPNIIDCTVGETRLCSSLPALEVVNHFNVSGIKKDALIDKISKHGIETISTNAPHDLLVLAIFSKLIKRFENLANIKFFNSIDQKVSYGKNVFFSYIPQSNSVEYYHKNFINYINNLIETKYKGATKQNLANSLISPIIIHSLAHEVVHALKIPKSRIYDFAKKTKWSFELTPVNSKYLKSYRLPKKMTEVLPKNLKYNNRARPEILSEYMDYTTKAHDMITKRKDEKSYREEAMRRPWFTGTKSQARVMQLSFLKHHQLASIYALDSIEEWFAETLSMCIFKEFYPSSSKLDSSTRFENLIGIRPDVCMGEKFLKDSPSLKRCPDSPNCVVSFYPDDKKHYRKPYDTFKQNPISELKELMLKEGYKIESDREDYIHATETSSLFKFVDDIEFYYDKKTKELHYRSASRTGYYDFGVNKRRVVKLIKKMLIESFDTGLNKVK